MHCGSDFTFERMRFSVHTQEKTLKIFLDVEPPLSGCELANFV